MISILLVDDELNFLEVTRMFLEKGRGIRVTPVTSAEVALEMLKTSTFDAIISDYAMPGINGIDFMKQVRAMGDDTPFIIITGRGREDVVIDALNFGADLYLQKSADPRSQFSDLVSRIRNMVSLRAGHREEQGRLALLSQAMDMIPGIVFGIEQGREDVFCCVSGGALPLTGTGPDGLMKRGGKAFQDLIVQEDRDRVHDTRRDALASGEGYCIRYQIRTADGKVKEVLEEGHVVSGASREWDLEGYILDSGRLCAGRHQAR